MVVVEVELVGGGFGESAGWTPPRWCVFGRVGLEVYYVGVKAQGLGSNDQPYSGHCTARKPVGGTKSSDCAYRKYMGRNTGPLTSLDRTFSRNSAIPLHEIV